MADKFDAMAEEVFPKLFVCDPETGYRHDLSALAEALRRVDREAKEESIKAVLGEDPLADENDAANRIRSTIKE